MRNKLYLLLLATIAMVGIGFTACSEDDFTDSIFDTKDYPLDRHAYSFPLDTFLKVNFLEPYNLKFIYRMEDIGSDMNKNLTPASYETSMQLAVLAKYLWYDVYEMYGGPEFLKKNSPRIIHVIGSKSYNTSQGTETLGVAEGGLKITLYNVNNLNVNDIDMMNEYFFKTMHHEFAHILDQTRIHPTAFNLLCNGQYDASSWSDTPDSVAAGRGFMSPYASSSTSEDWVETLANYVTLDTLAFERLMGAASYEWELIDMEYSDYLKRRQGAESLDTVGGRDGVAIINQKLDYVRGWLKDNWGISLDDLRREVQQRQYLTNPDGSFVFTSYGTLVNRLTSPLPDEPNVLLMTRLLMQVLQYNKLQQ